jgi:5'(3')-deoxyribonucleotidase
MNKKILYIDMDGVVADFDGMIREIYPEFDNHPEEEKSTVIDEIVYDHDYFFSDLKPIDGSKEIVNKLFNLFDVYFLSTPMWEVTNSFSHKRIWLEGHYGENAKKKLILTHRKDLNIGDFLVDDRLKNGASEFKGEHIHFGTEKYPNWEEVYKYLITKK